MRYAYGLTSVLLAGGAALSLATGFPAGAQVAQNHDSRMDSVVPRAGAPASFAELTEQLQPAVVNISTRQRVEVQQSRNPFQGTPFEELFNRRQGNQGTPRNGEPQYREGTSLGSGFFISADGYVVTNNHVVAAADRGTVTEITVTLPDGSEYEAELVGNDADSDLAVLKVNRREPFPFVEFGDSTLARPGDWVVAIGNPFGIGSTVTAGVISAVQRVTGIGAYDRFLQTDAAINRGNSGGPLFDMQGNVIGINSQIFSPSGVNVGIGFAIPAEDAAPIVEQLRRGENVARGYLGVGIAPVTDDLAASLGIERSRGEIIQSVQPGEGAERAGIQPGDIVLRVNRRDVTPEQTLSFLVARIAPGETIPIDLIRNGQRRTLNVTIGQRPPADQMRQQQMFSEDDEAPTIPDDDGMVLDRLGLQLVAVTPQIARELRIDADTQGLAVFAVDPNSDAARKGIQRRDVILSVNYREVAQVADIEAAIRQAQSEDREAVLLRIQRGGGQTQYVPVRLR